MRQLSLRLGLALIAFCCCSGILLAETVKGHISYVSQSSVYVDLGLASGLAKGNQGTVRRDTTVIGRLEVLFVSDKSASCKIVETSGEPKTGDEVVFEVEKSASALQPDSTRSPASQPMAGLDAPSRARSKKQMRLTGQVALQTFGVEDLESSNRSYVQPLLLVNGRLEHIAQSYYSLAVMMRTRWTNRQLQPAGSTRSEWNTRIFEAALSYDNPASNLQYALGRIRSNRIAGIGDFDGASFNYTLNGVWSVGAFGGMQPDYRTSGIETKITKYGIYGGYESGDLSLVHFESVLAAAGDYYKGSVNREFLYEQMSLSGYRKLSLFQSGEITINRGWRKQAEHKSLQLSNLLLNVRYTPVSFLTTSINYDNRTNYRTYETKTTPDTLFDNHLQQGLWLGVECNPYRSVTISANGGLRKKAGESQSTRTNSLGVSLRNAAGSGVYASVRVNTFKNTYSNGYQPELSLSRSLLPTLDAGLQLGQDHYDLRLSKETVTTNWVKLNLSYLISRKLYASTYAELYRGGHSASNRFFVELGYRL